jgi:hypothetical protein
MRLAWESPESRLKGGYHKAEGVALGFIIPAFQAACTTAFQMRPVCFHKVVQLATVPRIRHTCGMTATVKLDGSNRIVLSRDLRRAAGIPRGQKLKVSATPGRVVLEVEPNRGKVVKRGKLKTWTGQVPSTPIEEAVNVVRHYER